MKQETPARQNLMNLRKQLLNNYQHAKNHQNSLRICVTIPVFNTDTPKLTFVSLSLDQHQKIILFHQFTLEI